LLQPADQSFSDNHQHQHQYQHGEPSVSRNTSYIGFWFDWSLVGGINTIHFSQISSHLSIAITSSMAHPTTRTNQDFMATTTTTISTVNSDTCSRPNYWQLDNDDPAPPFDSKFVGDYQSASSSLCRSKY
jgi:hypothetical protein